MTSENVSGGIPVTLTTKLTGASWSPNALADNADLAGFPIASDSSGAPFFRLRIVPRVNRPPHKNALQPRTQARPEDRAEIRRHWIQAKTKSADMLAAARSADSIGLFNAARDLDCLLDDMWQLREARELDWRGVLNFLQGVLKQLRKERKLEVLQPAQCDAIQRIVADHLGPATKDKEDVKHCLRLLEEAGLDPWESDSPVESEE